MIEGFIRGLLGPSLVPVLDYIENHPTVIGLIFFILVAVYAAGRFQLHHILLKTQSFVLERSQEEMKRKKNISANSLYKIIYPDWAVEVKKWGFSFLIDSNCGQ